MREILNKAMLMGFQNAIQEDVTGADFALSLSIPGIMEHRPEMAADILEWIIDELRDDLPVDPFRHCVELLLPQLNTEAHQSILNRLEWELLMCKGQLVENIAGNGRKSCDKGLDQQDIL